MNVAFSKSNKNLVGYKVRRKVCIDICKSEFSYKQNIFFTEMKHFVVYDSAYIHTKET